MHLRKKGLSLIKACLYYDINGTFCLATCFISGPSCFSFCVSVYTLSMSSLSVLAFK